MSHHNPAIYNHLMTLAQALHIEVKEDSLDGGAGGLYLFKGKRTLLINKILPLDQKIDLLVDVLRKENLTNMYIVPLIRDILGK